MKSSKEAELLSWCSE